MDTVYVIADVINSGSDWLGIFCNIVQTIALCFTLLFVVHNTKISTELRNIEIEKNSTDLFFDKFVPYSEDGIVSFNKRIYFKVKGEFLKELLVESIDEKFLIKEKRLTEITTENFYISTEYQFSDEENSEIKRIVTAGYQEKEENAKQKTINIYERI